MSVLMTLSDLERRDKRVIFFQADLINDTCAVWQSGYSLQNTPTVSQNISNINCSIMLTHIQPTMREVEYKIILMIIIIMKNVTT